MRNKSKKNKYHDKIKKYFVLDKNKSKKGKIGGGENKQPVLYDDIGIPLKVKSFHPIPVVQFNFKPNQLAQLKENKACSAQECPITSIKPFVNYMVSQILLYHYFKSTT